MIDGKVHANITGTSMQCCTVCKASPKQMNDLEGVRRRDVNSASLLLGLSTMHAWIRFFEAVVHLCYKLGIKKWRAVTKEDKQQLAAKKQQVQEQFWKRLHLHVDKPRQGGGSSNDGNTSRRAFQAEDEFADITGVDRELIHRLHVILQVSGALRVII